MVTFAQALSDRSQQWCVIIQIDGVGPYHTSVELNDLDSDGRTRFCTQIPDYAETSTGAWLSTLIGDPDLLGEMPDPLGGTAGDDGSIEFAILDKDDYLTDLIRPESFPITAIDGDHTASDTTIDVVDATGISDTDLMFVGSEVFWVDSIASNTVTVDRAHLGTDAVSHDDGDAVFLYNTYLVGRRCTLKIVPRNADDSGEETEEVAGVVTRWAWDPLCNFWRFSVSTQSKHLDRVAPLEPRSIRVFLNAGEDSEARGYDPTERHYNTLIINSEDKNLADEWQLWPGNSVNFLYFQTSRGEVVGSEYAHDATVILSSRALVGTRKSSISAGDRLTQVFIADTRYGEGDFRFSPGPTPSDTRSSGTWTQTAHFCDICRIIMTSSSGDDDDLDITNNYISASGNFASLPPGFGLGIPSNSSSNLIDHASWADVKARTLDVLFPNFVYGYEPVPFLELVSDNFLKPLGAYIIYRSGEARIVLPRIPLIGFSNITLGPAALLKKSVAPGLYEPRINSLEMDVGRQNGSVIYELGPQKKPITVKSGTFQGTFGQRGYYGTSDKPIKVPVPGADADAEDLWIRLAESRLFRRHRPRMTIDADFDFGAAYGSDVGDVASITMDEIPDLNGGRGVSGLRAEIEEREPVLKRDEIFVRLKMRGYGTGLNVGRIAPAAIITGVAGNVATVAANRFTKTDATGGLPNTDASAFTVDDVVNLVNLDGTDASSGTQIITNISGNDITLDGDFGGDLNEDLVLVFASAEFSNAQQTDNYSYMSDLDRLGVDATSPYVYGEA